MGEKANCARVVREQLPGSVFMALAQGRAIIALCVRKSLLEYEQYLSDNLMTMGCCKPIQSPSLFSDQSFLQLLSEVK